MHFYLACFDISDDRIRYRVGKALNAYGTRIQRSVFEISVKNENNLKLLRAEIAELLEPGDDCRFYFLCRACRQHSHDATGHRVAYLPAAVIV